MFIALRIFRQFGHMMLQIPDSVLQWHENTVEGSVCCLSQAVWSHGCQIGWWMDGWSDTIDKYFYVLSQSRRRGDTLTRTIYQKTKPTTTDREGWGSIELPRNEWIYASWMPHLSVGRENKHIIIFHDPVAHKQCRRPRQTDKHQWG